MVTHTSTAGNATIPHSLPVPVGLPADQAVIALGGDLKSVISLMKADEVQSTEVFGDLADPGAYRRFLAAVAELRAGAETLHVTVSHDLHPGYLSTALALRSHLPRVSVQHHQAHMAACLVDNHDAGPAIGITCDGTGYGTDGAIWGCEVLVGDFHRFERLGHLREFSLPGGDAAARETWRPALSLVREAYGDAWRAEAEELLSAVPSEDLATVELMLKRQVNCVRTSSLGRLFDAAAFLLGLCAYNQSEAQAAVALERCASDGHAGQALPFDVVSMPEDEGGGIVMDVRPTIRTLVQRVRDGRNRPDLAADFHETIIAMLAATVEMVVDRVGIRKAALSGGCFLNRRLLEGLTAQLERRAVTVLRHNRVPTGDAGLSVGQAVIATARIGAGQDGEPLKGAPEMVQGFQP